MRPDDRHDLGRWVYIWLGIGLIVIALGGLLTRDTRDLGFLLVGAMGGFCVGMGNQLWHALRLIDAYWGKR